jgi:hypothetical protein
MRSQDSVFNLVESLKEKLEWVTPKITLMGAEETEGKQTHTAESTRNVPNCVGGCWTVGPS